MDAPNPATWLTLSTWSRAWLSGTSRELSLLGEAVHCSHIVTDSARHQRGGI